MKNILFVCSQNRLRSPTAEQIFAGHPNYEVDSAGTNNDAENPLTGELVDWADMIFVMEKRHRTLIQKRYRAKLKKARLIVLDIPDDFGFMDYELIRLLKSKLSRFLTAVDQTSSTNRP